MRNFLLICLLVGLTVSFGCGGSAPQMKVSGPFLLTDGSLFDDGVDFVAQPSELTGRWKEEFAQDLDQRIERADAIAVVRVDALGSELSPDGLRTYLLSVTPTKRLKGQVADALTLPSPQHSQGFGTVERSRARLLKERFTAFLRYYERDNGSVGVHFHLSPESDGVTDAIQAKLNPATAITTTVRTTENR